MTSEELYELCKPHIGKPWWPALFNKQAWKDLHDDQSFVESAEAMILGAAVAWLVTRIGCNTLTVCRREPDLPFFRILASKQIGRAPTLLAAALAACAAVEGGGE